MLPYSALMTESTVINTRAVADVVIGAASRVLIRTAARIALFRIVVEIGREERIHGVLEELGVRWHTGLPTGTFYTHTML